MRKQFVQKMPMVRQRVGVTLETVVDVFLESGAFTVPAGVNSMDVFLVGGGASGANFVGGGGGYTNTEKNIPVTSGDTWTVTVGDGGARNARQNGQASKIEETSGALRSYQANGGNIGGSSTGGNGGSGGAPYDSGAGGSDGGNGENTAWGSPGTGQDDRAYGTDPVEPYNTTREFGDYDGALYSGGGGGGRSSGGPGGPGGDGGGGDGDRGGNAQDGEPNTGGGGGGDGQTSTNGGAGGSGIVKVRYKLAA